MKAKQEADHPLRQGPYELTTAGQIEEGCHVVEEDPCVVVELGQEADVLFLVLLNYHLDLKIFSHPETGISFHCL